MPPLRIRHAHAANHRITIGNGGTRVDGGGPRLFDVFEIVLKPPLSSFTLASKTSFTMG